MGLCENKVILSKEKEVNLDDERLVRYLERTRLIILGTVLDGSPSVRTMASFATEGFTTFFSTHKDTGKVRQIELNPQVAVLFQHEKQKLDSFCNITISGIARRVEEEGERQRVIELIGARSTCYLERARRGDLVEHLFYRVEPLELKVLDFRISPGPEGARILSFPSRLVRRAS